MAETAQASQQAQQAKEQLNVAQQLEQSCDELAKYGGFDLLEASIDGTQNMNPERRARKRIFLNENAKKQERESLKKRLEVWVDLLSNGKDLADMITTGEEKAVESEQMLAKNLKKAVASVRDMEQSYRSLALFFKNTDMDKLPNVSIMNADLEQITDLDNDRFISAVSEEMQACFDRLDLRENYSILVLPGYLGSNKVLDKWSKIAHQNKVMLVTDFEHLDTPEDVIELFEAANHTSGDAYKSNVVMGCNWLVGRERYQDLGEEEELYVPPSSALAGTIYKTLMSQVSAGKKFGALSEIDGVKFDLKKSEIANLEKLGLVPMVNEYGKVMAFSAKTLFNGDNIGLKTYSVVRVFDWVTKVLMDFLNRRAFENFNVNTKKEIRGQIVKFLDSIAGPGRIIEKFKILKFEQDPQQKDRVFLDIHISPYFPAKNFLIKLDGTKGDDPDSAEWKSEYEQE